MSDRVHREIHALADQFNSIRFDPDRSRILVNDYPLPDGWNHETTTIVIELPDEYPHSVPGVSVPDDLRFEGTKPYTLMSTTLDGWDRVDLRPLRTQWQPERHTVVTVLRRVHGWLDAPTRGP